jgi:hypothetical protein
MTASASHPGRRKFANLTGPASNHFIAGFLHGQINPHPLNYFLSARFSNPNLKIRRNRDHREEFSKFKEKVNLLLL